MTDRAGLLEEIEAATEAIRVAEVELQEVVGGIARASRADKSVVGDAVETASLKLKAAQAQLSQLEDKLIELDQSAPLTQLEAARAAVAEADKSLAEVLRKIEVAAGADTTWVSKVVRDAFTRLRVARATLDDIAANARDDD